VIAGHTPLTSPSKRRGMDLPSRSPDEADDLCDFDFGDLSLGSSDGEEEDDEPPVIDVYPRPRRPSDARVLSVELMRPGQDLKNFRILLQAEHGVMTVSEAQRLYRHYKRTCGGAPVDAIEPRLGAVVSSALPSLTDLVDGDARRLASLGSDVLARTFVRVLRPEAMLAGRAARPLVVAQTVIVGLRPCEAAFDDLLRVHGERWSVDVVTVMAPNTLTVSLNLRLEEYGDSSLKGFRSTYAATLARACASGACPDAPTIMKALEIDARDAAKLVDHELRLLAARCLVGLLMQALPRRSEVEICGYVTGAKMPGLDEDEVLRALAVASLFERPIMTSTTASVPRYGAEGAVAQILVDIVS
jgi:hypothetical protein